jgi:hypothetical protein
LPKYFYTPKSFAQIFLHTQKFRPKVLLRTKFSTHPKVSFQAKVSIALKYELAYFCFVFKIVFNNCNTTAIQPHYNCIFNNRDTTVSTTAIQWQYNHNTTAYSTTAKLLQLHVNYLHQFAFKKKSLKKSTP